MKAVALLTIHLLAALLISHSGLAEALVNDASLLNVHWSEEDLALWSKQHGTDGPPPIQEGGALVLSMEGATGGSTFVRKAISTPNDFIITTRVAVDRFPSMQGWGSYPDYNGIQLLRIYQDDTIIVQVTPDRIRIASWANESNGTLISIPTEEGKFYTWQFEIAQAEGPDAGTVRIYRREEDSQPWTQLGDNIPLLPSDFGDNIPLMTIYHNEDDPESQGVVRQEYFLAGVAGESSDNP